MLYKPVMTDTRPWQSFDADRARGAAADRNLKRAAMRKSYPRILDVAEAAGVSTATVSRALSAPDRVSADTRAIVFKAVEATGYRVNHAARNLRRREAGGIVVLVPNLANPFFSQILAGIAAEMAPSGRNVLVADTRQPGATGGMIADYLHNNRADGLIVLDAQLPGDILGNGAGAEHHPPIVFACEWLEDDARPRITVDNEGGARLAIAHLAALGHERIGHLRGPAGNILTVTRESGTRAAMAAAGIAVRKEWFFDGDFSLDSGARAAQRWLQLAERPSAVFCASDAMACGFIGALHRHGISVPGDVSVVGFDDIEIAAHFVPPLTTIAQPRLEIGRRAARMLFGAMSAGEAEDKRLAADLLPVELVVRASTAAPRG